MFDLLVSRCSSKIQLQGEVFSYIYVGRMLAADHELAWMGLAVNTTIRFIS